MRLKEECIFMLLGVIGIVIGFVPIMRVGDVTISLIDYGQSGALISIGIFEHLRVMYMAVLFASVFMLGLSVPSLFMKSYILPDDVKFIATLAYTFSLVPLTFFADIPKYVVSHVYSNLGITVYLDLSNAEILPTYLIINCHGIPLLFVVSLIVLIFYSVKIVTKIMLNDHMG